MTVANLRLGEQTKQLHGFQQVLWALSQYRREYPTSARSKGGRVLNRTVQESCRTTGRGLWLTAHTSSPAGSIVARLG